MSKIKEQLEQGKPPSQEMNTNSLPHNTAYPGSLKGQQQWKSNSLETNLERWDVEHPAHKFENIDPNIVVEKNNEHAPNVPLSLIDKMLSLAKNSSYGPDLPKNIKKIRVYLGGSNISIKFVDTEGKQTHIYFDSVPPFDVYHLSKND